MNFWFKVLSEVRMIVFRSRAEKLCIMLAGKGVLLGYANSWQFTGQVAILLLRSGWYYTATDGVNSV